MAKTIRETLIAGLKAKGWTEAESVTTKKFIAFKHPQEKAYLFVGKKGALRSGPMVSQTRSLDGTAFRRGFLKDGSV